jgi:hypothetical protein
MITMWPGCHENRYYIIQVFLEERPLCSTGMILFAPKLEALGLVTTNDTTALAVAGACKQ